MRRLHNILVSLGVSPALAQDKATIEKLNDAWTAAFNKGDAAAVAAMYTEDAYVLPPGGEYGQGPRRYRGAFGGRRRSRWPTPS